MSINSIGTIIIDGFKWAGQGISTGFMTLGTGAVKAITWAGKGLGNGLSLAGTGIKNGALFLADKIAIFAQFLWTNTGPAFTRLGTFLKTNAQRAWPHIQNGAIKAFTVIRTSGGLVGTGLTVGTLCLVASHNTTGLKSVAFTALGIASFVGAGFALHIGMTSGFGFPVI